MCLRAYHAMRCTDDAMRCTDLTSSRVQVAIQTSFYHAKLIYLTHIDDLDPGRVSSAICGVRCWDGDGGQCGAEEVAQCSAQAGLQERTERVRRERVAREFKCTESMYRDSVPRVCPERTGPPALSNLPRPRLRSLPRPVPLSYLDLDPAAYVDLDPAAFLDLYPAAFLDLDPAAYLDLHPPAYLDLHPPVQYLGPAVQCLYPKGQWLPRPRPIPRRPMQGDRKYHKAA
eukprot:3057067-Rhodomonas_salina.3